MTPRLINLLSLLFCVLFSSSVCGQTDTTQIDSSAQIPFVANWAVGDSFRYSITEIKLGYVGDSTVTNDTVRYEADFVVADSTAKGYEVIWDRQEDEDPEYTEFLEQAPEEYKRRMDSLGDLRLRFRTDELGQYEGLANANEMQRAMEVLAPEMAAFIIENDTMFSKAMNDRQKKAMIKYTSKKMAESYVSEKLEGEDIIPVVHLLSPLGAQYMLYDTTEVSIDIEATLPDKTVLQHLRAYFDDYFPEEGYVHMKLFTQIDEADGILLLAESLRQKGFDENKIQDFVQNGYYLEREDNDFYYYYRYGLAEGVDCYKEITIEAPGEERVVNIQQYIINLIRAVEDE